MSSHDAAHPGLIPIADAVQIIGKSRGRFQQFEKAGRITAALKEPGRYGKHYYRLTDVLALKAEIDGRPVNCNTRPPSALAPEVLKDAEALREEMLTRLRGIAMGDAEPSVAIQAAKVILANLATRKPPPASIPTEAEKSTPAWFKPRQDA